MSRETSPIEQVARLVGAVFLRRRHRGLYSRHHDEPVLGASLRGSRGERGAARDLQGERAPQPGPHPLGVPGLALSRSLDGARGFLLAEERSTSSSGSMAWLSIRRAPPTSLRSTRPTLAGLR